MGRLFPPNGAPSDHPNLPLLVANPIHLPMFTALHFPLKRGSLLTPSLRPEEEGRKEGRKFCFLLYSSTVPYFHMLLSYARISLVADEIIGMDSFSIG